MARAILYVESRPKDPARLEEYHRWFDEVHLAEVVAAAGFVSARRFDPVDDDAPFLAIFEIEDNELSAVKERVANARNIAPLSPSQADLVTVRYYRERTAYVAPVTTGSTLEGTDTEGSD